MKALSSQSYPPELLALMLEASEKEKFIFLRKREDSIKLRSLLYGMRRRLTKAGDPTAPTMNKVTISIMSDGDYENGMTSGLYLRPNFHEYLDAVKGALDHPLDTEPSLVPSPEATPQIESPAPFNFDDALHAFQGSGEATGSGKGENNG